LIINILIISSRLIKLLKINKL